MARMMTSSPARKVVYGSLGAAFATLAIYMVETFVIKQALPIAVSGAITTIVTFVVGYVVPPNIEDQVVAEPAAA